MLTKDLEELTKDLNAYNQLLAECETDEEKDNTKNDFISSLRVYLPSAKTAVKDIFKIELTPFITEEATYDGLMRKTNAEAIVKKTKMSFYEEIDQLINSEIYQFLKEEQKQKIDHAFYIFKTYYEDNLN